MGRGFLDKGGGDGGPSPLLSHAVRNSEILRVLDLVGRGIPDFDAFLWFFTLLLTMMKEKRR